MGVCVYVSNPFNRTRQLVNNVNLNENIAVFKHNITDTTGIQPNKQELIFMGECLEDEERSLQSYGVENNVTVFVYEKVGIEEKEGEGGNKEDEVKMGLEELQGILSKARNPLYRNSVKQLVKNKEALRKAIKTSSTNTDRVTPALVEDSDLLLAIIESAPAEKILENYPLLCGVMKHIISNASLESSGHQRFQDDDDDSELMGIDPAFLAQAEMLAASEAGGEQSSSSSTSTQQQQTPRQPPANRHRISATDLANALSFATMTPTAGGATPAAAAEPAVSAEEQQQTELALQQMRAMGITDDEVSRRALSMSGGVVEAALNLIFEGALE